MVKNTVKRILEDLRNGNPQGEGYTIKEILTAHIHDNREYHEKLFDEIKNIRANYTTKQMVFGMFGLLFTLISALASYVFLK